MCRKLILFCILFNTSVYAATVPTGIPEPPFGLDQTVANTVGNGNNDYATYWIDNTDGNCSDSGNPNGSQAAPRCTIPDLTFLIAGDVVQVRGGSYTLPANLTISGTGTPLAPIFVRGQSAQNKTAIDLNGKQIDINGSYIVFENFSLTGRDEAISAGGTTYSTVRFNEITGTGTSVDGNGAMIGGGGSSYLVRAFNQIHDGGDWTSTSENDMHALGVGSNQTYTWDLYNTVYHVAGDASGNGHSANHTTHHLYIGGNIFHNCRENAVDLKEVHDVVISENKMYGYDSTGSSSGEAVVLHYGPTSNEGPYNIYLVNNLIHDSRYGVVTSDVQSAIYMIGNVVRDCSVRAMNPDRSGGYVYLYHNTLVDNASGIVSTGGGAALNALESHGNIVAFTSADHLSIDSSTVRGLAVIDHELYWQGNGLDVSIDWGSIYNSVAAWNIAHSPIGDHSKQQDPRFTDYAAGDFSILKGSPATNAGYDMRPVMAAYLSKWGAALDKDMAGNKRPAGVWDMGAYQAPVPNRFCFDGLFLLLLD